jgi:hypothetical protein
MTTKATDFELVDHGIDHPDYFQGCGVAFTSYANVVTGIGSNPAEAIEDALEQVASSEQPVDTDDLEKRILADIGKRSIPRRPVAKGDTYYHVSIRWNA